MSTSQESLLLGRAGHLTASRPCNQAMPVRPTPAIKPTAITEIKRNIERPSLLAAYRSIAPRARARPRMCSHFYPHLSPGALHSTSRLLIPPFHHSAYAASVLASAYALPCRGALPVPTTPHSVHKSATTSPSTISVWPRCMSSSFGTTQASHGVA